MMANDKHLRKVRSFVKRDSRMTEAQLRVMTELWPQYGIDIKDSSIDFSAEFQTEGLPIFLEIGFGSGYSLFELAKANPLQNFIGVETHKPGVGALMVALNREPLNNLKIFYADANDVLNKCIADASLDGIQLFFPDPWPKRKHHKRRLIQDTFIALLSAKLKTNGVLHLATDWEHYAHHMMQVLSNSAMLRNIAGIGQYSPRSMARPIVTKFEKTGLNSGRAIWELQFQKI